MKYASVKEDFHGFIKVDSPALSIIGEHAWSYSLVGAGGITSPSSESGAPGILRLTTGGSSADRVSLGFGSFLPADVSHFKGRVRVSHTSSIEVVLGLGNDLTSATFGTESIFFKYVPGSDATSHAVTRSASTNDDQDLNLAMSTTLFQGFEFVRASASLWHAYTISSSGVRTWRTSHATNIPTGVLAFGVRVETKTAATRHVEIDRLELYSSRLSR